MGNTNVNYKCPFNYVGSKSKILPVLIDIFEPYGDKIFVDLFGGGFSVGANVINQRVIYNDINSDLTKLIQVIYNNDFESFEKKLIEKIEFYGLSKINSEAFYKLRKDFNEAEEKDSYLFALLIFYSFNYQIRYNQRGEYNTPFGKNRSSYNLNSHKKMEIFSELIHNKEIEFYSKDYNELDINPEMIVYADPPYLVTTGSYNDGKRGVTFWDLEQEKKLYLFLDKLDREGIPFVLSNMLYKGNNYNEVLHDWSQKYNCMTVETMYRNYRRKDNETKEIIVKNF